MNYCNVIVQLAMWSICHLSAYDIPTVDFLQKQIGETLTLVCISNDKTGFSKKPIEWILPSTSDCLSDSKCNNRLSMQEEDGIDHFKINLILRNLKSTDTGVYRCVPKGTTNRNWENYEARKWLTSEKHSQPVPLNSLHEIQEKEHFVTDYYEQRIYVYVNGSETGQLFVPSETHNNVIFLYNYKVSYINCKVTDPTLTTALYLKNNVVSTIEYNDQFGFIIKPGDFGGVNSAEVECRAILNKSVTDVLKFHLKREDTVSQKEKFHTIIFPESLPVVQLNKSNITLICKANKLQNVNCSWYFNGNGNVKQWYVTPRECYSNEGKLAKCLPPKVEIFPNNSVSNLTLTGLNIFTSGVYTCNCYDLSTKDSISSAKIIAVRDNKPSIEVTRGNFRQQIVLLENDDKSHEHVVIEEFASTKLWAKVNIFIPKSIFDKKLSIKWYYRSKTLKFASLKPDEREIEEVHFPFISLKTDLLSNGSNNAVIMLQYYLELFIKKTLYNDSADYILHIRVNDVAVKYEYRLFVRTPSRNRNIFVTNEESLAKKVNPSYLEFSKHYYIWCISEGYPIEYPTLSAESNAEDESNSGNLEGRHFETTYLKALRVDYTATKNMQYSCTFYDTNGHKLDIIRKDFSISDIPNAQDNNAFRLDTNPPLPYIFEGADLILKCRMQLSSYDSVTWYYSPLKFSDTSSAKAEIVWGERSTSENKLSVTFLLTIKNIQQHQSGVYYCDRSGKSVKQHQQNRTKEPDDIRSVHINVQKIVPPFVGENNSPKRLNFKTSGALVCDARGWPPPAIQWFKDGIPYQPQFGTLLDNDTVLQLSEENGKIDGNYECRLTNYANQTYSAYFKVNDGKSDVAWFIMASVLGTLAVTIIFIIYFGRRKWKRKQEQMQNQQEELREHLEAVREQQEILREIQRQFMASADEHPADIDSNIPLHEQAESLRYDRRFEIPSSSLPMLPSECSPLGRGHFGIVVKSFLYVVVPPERHAVAVKTVPNTLPLKHIRNQHMEIKIMIHVGDHVNILPLIGAVTETLPDNNMYIVTECCEQGSLLGLLKNCRASFVDEMILCLNNSSNGTKSASNSEYDGLNYLAVTKKIPNHRHRFHPENNYQTNDLCTSDLLCYAYQTANGMEYLTSKHIIHRDLAARNILITKNNIIKISDFGLSRFGEIYQLLNKEAELPFQWLSLESLVEYKFSAKSDIWSFGIVLWEMTNLGVRPYPEFPDFNKTFIDVLINGYRNVIPFEFESEPIYQLMRKCWSYDPNARPNYSECKETIEKQLRSLCQYCSGHVKSHLNDSKNVTNYDELRSKFGQDIVLDTEGEVVLKRDSRRRPICIDSNVRFSELGEETPLRTLLDDNVD